MYHFRKRAFMSKSSSVISFYLRIYFIALIGLLTISDIEAQVEELPCQTEANATIDLDRKDFNNGSTVIHSQASMHNFTLPENTFGDCKYISNVSIEITGTSVDYDFPAGCNPPGAFYYNIALGCEDFTPASCNTSNLIGEPNTPNFVDQSFSYNGPPEDFQFGDNISVDIVPVMDQGTPCGQNALSEEYIILEYDLCVTVTISEGAIDDPIDLGMDLESCAGGTNSLFGGNYDDWLWSNGQTAQSINVGPGDYSITVTDSNGCTDTDEITIEAFPDAPITFDPADPIVCDNESITVSVVEGSYDSYEWSNSEEGQTVNLTPGTYDVTITDDNDCTTVNTVTVSSIPSPNAGTDNTETICEGVEFDLSDLVESGADVDGVFSDPAATGSLSGSIVNTSGLADQTIDFLYTVGLPGDLCGSDEATFTLIIEAQAVAGADNSETVCAEIIFDLNDLVDAAADLGGTFSDPGATGALDGSMVNTTGFEGQTLDFIYEVGDGTDACGVDQATLTLIIEDAPNAGIDNSAEVCEQDFFDLNDLLDINADAGGVFLDVAATGSLSGSTVNTLGLGGLTIDYVYQVGDAADPCGVDEATLTLVIGVLSEAGQDNVSTVCDGELFDLNDILGSDADLGGVYLDPNDLGILNGSIVNTTGLEGQTIDFIYEVGFPGDICGIDQASLVIIVESTVQAGEDNFTTVCEGNTFDLNDLLDASASPGGIFLDPTSSGVLSGSIVNTSGLAGQTIGFIYQVGQSSDPCGMDESILTITVDFSLSAGDDSMETICIAGVINLDDFLVNADFGGVYNDIDLSGGLNGNLLNTDVISPGQYIYQYIVGDGITCPFDTANITILFNAIPEGVFEIDTVELCYDICQEINISVIGGSPFTYDLSAENQSGTPPATTTLSSSTNDFSVYLCNDQSQIAFSNDTLNFSNLDSLLLTIENVQGDLCNSVTIDSLWITSLPANVFQLDTSICIFDTLFIDDLEFFFGNSSFIDTIDGIECDSFININVSFEDVDTSYILETICPGDSTNYFSTWFTEANPYEEITINAESGCDSLIIVDISFFPQVDSLINPLLCEGDFIIVNTVTYDESNPFGQEVLIGASSNGCDSLVNIDLQFSNGINIMRTDTLCEGGSIVIGGTIFDATNNPNLLIVPGVNCDTTFDINLTFVAPSMNVIDGIYCVNFDTIVNGVLYDFDNPSDVETIVGGSSLGCDSIITINLNFESPSQNIIDGIYCSDFDTLVNDVLYNINNPSDIETIVGGSYLGCDSIITIDLNYYPVAQNILDTTICSNESFIINGVTYDQNNLSGTETLTSQLGCDSTIVITVSLYNTTEEDQSFAICEGDSIFLMGAWQFSAGVFMDTFTTSFGCDSIITSTVSLMPCAIEVNVSAVGNNCVGGSLGLIDIEILSEIPIPYIILLEELSTGIQSNINVSVEQNNYQFENLNSGSYEVSIIENDGTVIFTTTEVINDLFDALTGSWNLIETIICNGELAQLEFVPTGGLPDYNYTWSTTNLGNASIIDQVPSGAYSITISDMNGCTFDSSFTIDEPTPITYDLQTTNISCIGLESGDITIENIQGGTSPYSVLIDNVIINEFFISSLSEGQYTIEILDDNGCISISNQVNITGSTSVTLADYTLTHDITEGNSVLLDGELFENNLSFEWSPNSTLSCVDCMEPIASPSTTTIYELTVTNEDGCEQIINITVIVSPNVIIQVFPNIFSPNGDGSNDEFLLTFENELTTKIELIVFDRWGNQMHNSISSDGTIMWNGASNGRDLNPGVYIYQLTIDYIDGTSETMVNDLTLIK